MRIQRNRTHEGNSGQSMPQKFDKYACPGCGGRVMRPEGRHYMLARWSVHNGCTVTCSLCDETIARPAVGQAWKIEAWNGDPVHAACKVKEMGAHLATRIHHGEEES